MSEKLTFQDAQDALKDVAYKDGWQFELESDCDCVGIRSHSTWCREYAENTWRLRLSCPVVDALDGSNRIAYGRWWSIPYQTKGDVVRTAFLACLTMEEHECREEFKYKGLAVFGPHLDLDLLVAMAHNTEHQPDFVTDWLDATA